MASFVPHHRKKIEQLEKRERTLKRLLDSGATREKLLAAASDVRDARIRVLRAKQNELNPMEEVAFQRLKAKIAAIQEVPAEKILAEFSKSN
jgi:hypothetical protein